MCESMAEGEMAAWSAGKGPKNSSGGVVAL